MKKKIALMLAAVMTFAAAALPFGAHAASANYATKTFNAREGSEITNANGAVDFSSLAIELTPGSVIKAGETITLTLTNGKWAFGVNSDGSLKGADAFNYGAYKPLGVTDESGVSTESLVKTHVKDAYGKDTAERIVTYTANNTVNVVLNRSAQRTFLINSLDGLLFAGTARDMVMPPLLPNHAQAYTQFKSSTSTTARVWLAAAPGTVTDQDVTYGNGQLVSVSEWFKAIAAITFADSPRGAKHNTDLYTAPVTITGDDGNPLSVKLSPYVCFIPAAFASNFTTFVGMGIVVAKDITSSATFADSGIPAGGYAIFWGPQIGGSGAFIVEELIANVRASSPDPASGTGFISYVMRFSSPTFSPEKAVVEFTSNFTVGPTGATIYIPLNVHLNTVNSGDNRDHYVSIATTGMTSTAITPTTGKGVLINRDVASNSGVGFGDKTYGRDTIVLPELRLNENLPSTIRSGIVMLVAPEGYRWVPSELETEYDTLGFSGVSAQLFVYNGRSYFRPDSYDPTKANDFRFLEAGRLAFLSIGIGQTTTTLGSARIKGLTLRVEDENLAKFNEPLGIEMYNRACAGKMPRFYEYNPADGKWVTGDTSGVGAPQGIESLPQIGTASNQVSTYGNADRIGNKSLGTAGYFNALGLAYTDNVIFANIAERVDYGISMTTSNAYDKDLGSNANAIYYSGKNSLNSKIVTVRENAYLSWWPQNQTVYTLVDEDGNSLEGKVKINQVVVYGAEGFSDFPNTSDYASGSYPTKRIDAGVTYAADTRLKTTDQSFTTNLLNVKTNKLASFSFYFSLSAAADFEGDVYVKMEGRSIPGDQETPEPVLVASFEPPITVKTKSTRVQIGYQTVVVEDVNVKEVEPGILPIFSELTVRLSLFDLLSPDCYFIDTNSVKVQVGETDGNVGNPKFITTSAGMTKEIVVPVTRKATAKAIDFTITGLRIYINRATPQGNIDLQVGGDWVNNYSTNTNLGLGEFRTYGVTVADYIKVITEGANLPLTRNVVISQNSNEAIVDGEATTMEVPTYTLDDRLMVPLRFVGVLLGVDEKNIIWDGVSRSATIIVEGRTVVFHIGTSKVSINGTEINMTQDDNVTPVNSVINPEYDRAYLPFRWMGRVFGIDVGYNEETRTCYYNPTDEQVKDGAVVTY